VAALHSSAQFRADLDTARSEVAAARSRATAAAGMTCQGALASDQKRPW
jgi:hypothetical protein